MKLLMDGEILKYAVRWNDRAMPCRRPKPRAPRDILVSIANGSCGRTAAAADRVEQRGFAGAVSARSAVKRAIAADLEIDLRQRPDRSIATDSFSI